MCKEKDHPLDRSDPQPLQPVSGLDDDILNLVHAELEAHSEVPSRSEIDVVIGNYCENIILVSEAVRN